MNIQRLSILLSILVGIFCPLFADYRFNSRMNEDIEWRMEELRSTGMTDEQVSIIRALNLDVKGNVSALVSGSVVIGIMAFLGVILVNTRK